MNTSEIYALIEARYTRAEQTLGQIMKEMRECYSAHR
jgi:hypothetical protein